MRLLFRYIKLYKGVLFGALFLATINQVASLTDTQIFRLIIDRYATRVGELPVNDFVRGVGLLLLASIGLALTSRIAKNFQDYFVNLITLRVGTKMYADSVSHAFSLPYGVFEDQRSGEILEKLQRARVDSQNLIERFIHVVFLSAVGMVFVLAYAFYVHWYIGVALALSIPMLGTTTFLISRKIKKAQQKIVAKSTDLAGATTETLRNVELVKSLGLESQEVDRLNNVNDKILDLEMVKVRLVQTLLFIQGTLVNLTRAALLLLMLWLIFRGDITLGEFFTLMFYSFAVFSPLYELGSVVSKYQEANASLEMLGGVLSMSPEPKAEGSKQIETFENIEFRNVTFNYPSSELPSAMDINLKIGSGKTVAFVGPSGSGKTTMVKLAVGLYPPTKGEVFINGMNSKQIDRDSLRRRIGYVSQETQLFAGTVRENLLFVSPAASDEECLRALESSEAMNIIERGGKGLDTKIGEGGIKISGGERQRLAIARALLRNPELVIFDEATSSLDSITEKAITKTIQAISSSRKNLTSILVAHRLSTIYHADHIYVLEKGKIIEEGVHEELLRRKGLYAALWREQAGA